MARGVELGGRTKPGGCHEDYRVRLDSPTMRAMMPLSPRTGVGYAADCPRGASVHLLVHKVALRIRAKA